VLKEAVVAYMEEVGDTAHEDLMRTFFRSHVGNIGRLLNKVADIAIVYAKTPSSNVQEFLPEANRTIVVG
jgi:nuclear pore complex protein Nup133